MFTKRILIIGFVIILSGCASLYPLPIEEPKANDSSGKRTTPDYMRGGLSPAANVNGSIENLKIYGDAYQDYADKLRRNEYVSSDIGLAGGVLGVIGGLAKSVETAITGAVIASGSSIVSQRYQFLVQAANYEKASDAMYCMYSRLYPVKGGGISASLVNERIDEIRRKLRKVQSTVQLANPDLAQLEAALKKTIQDTKNKEKATADALKASGNALSIAESILDTAELELLKSELTKCVASF